MLVSISLHFTEANVSMSLDRRTLFWKFMAQDT